MPRLKLAQAREVHIDPEPDERGQLLAVAIIEGLRWIVLELNVN